MSATHLVSVGFVSVLTALTLAVEAGEPPVAPYAGRGGVIFTNEGELYILPGELDDDRTPGVVFRNAGAIFNPDTMVGEPNEVLRFGWLTVNPLENEHGFTVSVDPLERKGPGDYRVPVWATNGPVDPADPVAWMDFMRDLDADRAEWMAYHKPFQATMFLAAPEEPGKSPEQVAADLTAGQRRLAESGSANPAQTAPEDNCPGGSCSCTGASGGSAVACCRAGETPYCNCGRQQCCIGKCIKTRNEVADGRYD